MHTCVYRNLNTLISERGIKKKSIAEKLGISPRAFTNKMVGVSDFTWKECCIIRKNFFPDLDLDFIFEFNAVENKSA